MGNDVTVNGNGQLGVLLSSARYKRDIHDMGGASAGLMKLRPVSFRHKQDKSNERQYGLVAEEVQRHYLELVTLDAGGRPMSVHYQELIPMLLNELQKQNKELRKQAEELRKRATENHQQAEQIRSLSAQVRSNEQKVARLQVNHERELGRWRRVSSSVFRRWSKPTTRESCSEPR